MINSNKTRKNVLLKIFTMLLIFVAVLICVIVIALLTKEPEYLEISNIDIATIENGIYTGSADNGLVKVTVSVEVKEGKIQNISILEHDTLLGKRAENIIDNIIEQQSLEVDVISSATYSSDTIKKAIENALRKGE